MKNVVRKATSLRTFQSFWCCVNTMELINVCVSRKGEIQLKDYTHFDIFFIYIARRLLLLLAHKSIPMELTRKGADILDLDIQLTAVYLFR